jgi:hypothetical protein
MKSSNLISAAMAVGTILGRRRNLCCSPKRYFQPETSSPTVFGFQIEFDVVLQKNYVSAVIRSMSGWVLCHEAQPVQTAARNFIGDEGRSFGFGDQVADPKPPRAALVKSHGGERCGNVGTMIPAGTVERGERKRTVDEVSKAD